MTDRSPVESRAFKSDPGNLNPTPANSTQLAPVESREQQRWADRIDRIKLLVAHGKVGMDESDEILHFLADFRELAAELDRARDLAAHLEEQLAAKRRLPKDVCGARDGADVVCMLPPHSVELLPEGDPNHHRWHQDWRGGQLWAEWSSVTEHYDKGRLWPDGRIGPRAALAAHLEAEQAEERR